MKKHFYHKLLVVATGLAMACGIMDAEYVEYVQENDQLSPEQITQQCSGGREGFELAVLPAFQQANCISMGCHDSANSGTSISGQQLTSGSTTDEIYQALLSYQQASGSLYAKVASNTHPGQIKTNIFTETKVNTWVTCLDKGP